MGAVYLAVDESLQQQVALKTLLPALASDVRAIEKMKREVRTAQRLRHKSICATFDFRDNDGAPFIVMEYVEGDTLSNFIYRQPNHRCDEATFRRLAEEIVAAVEHAHKAGVVHRDLKPANIQVKLNGSICVMDFGIAASLKEVASETTGSAVTLSIRYASPEQINGEPAAPSMDIYSLGCVFYEMLSGEAPFPRGDILHQHLTRKPTAIPGVSDAVNRAILWCLEKEPSQRCADLKALHHLMVSQNVVDADRTVRILLDRTVRIDKPLPASPEIAEPAAVAVSQEVPPEAAQMPTLPPLRTGTAAPSKSGGRFLLWGGLAVCFAAFVAFLVNVNQPRQQFNQPAAPQKGDVRVNPKDGQRYAYIPPGTFRMGCSPGDGECDAKKEDETPANVTISKGFYLGESEVTQAAYQNVTGSTPSKFKGPDLPVDNVSWNEAQAYCQQIGGRLPTEAEWEYAARGGSPAARYTEVDRAGWYYKNSGSKTHDVKGKARNAFGLYDMLGNVTEWTNDWYARELTGGTDPQGPTSGTSKVLRGGSYGGTDWIVRASQRYEWGPDVRADHFGFRCGWE